jgi:hypothetical protein
VNDSREDRRVDALRQQLRTLGYLDAGLNRFVLGPAVDARRPAAIALLASMRIGMVAAVLLGPAAAIGLGGRLPALVTGPRDAVVISVYIGALLGGAVSIAALAASLIVASLAGNRIARRAATLSQAAGTAVAIGCLVYVTLWWRTANAGFGWAAPVWTAFALTVGVAISLVLGHAVRAAALAVIVAGRRDRGATGRDAGPVPSGASMSWRMALVVGVLAFAGAATLLVVTAPGSVRAESPAALTVVSTGVRVRLIAIDGFDPVVFEELASGGRVPALASCFSSARARLQAEDQPRSNAGGDPARAWTTIATGQPPSVHGVTGLETRRIAGVRGTVPTLEPSRLGAAIRTATALVRLSRPAIVSGVDRREKTLWEVAADAGLRTAVINWWATWPARTRRKAWRRDCAG